MSSTSIGTIWSQIDGRFIPDSEGRLKVAKNVEAVVSGIEEILKTRKGERCLSGETKVSLLDGRNIPIKKLVEEDKFWVYSFNHNTGMIEPDIGKACKTGRKKLIRVVLDSGESFDCTPDHKIMLRDGHFREAGNLIPGQSLMPLYLSTNKQGYLDLYQPIKHTLVKVKVERIEELGTEEVFDISTEKNHNFALSCGVFVHNCMLPSFGSVLSDILFEPLDGTATKILSRTVKGEIERWDNRVFVESVELYSDPDRSSLSVSILFQIRGYTEIFKLDTVINGEF